MRTLNLRKLRWIMREMHKRKLSVYRIAKQQGITPQHARRVYQRYKDVQLYKLNRVICLQKCGRKPRQSTTEEINAVLQVKSEMGLGALLAYYLSKWQIIYSNRSFLGAIILCILGLIGLSYTNVVKSIG